MARLLIVGGFLAAIFWVYSIVDCAVQPQTRHRGVSKGIWIAIVALVPVIGGILWFTLGRRRANDDGGAIRIVAPDDDPQFLRSISKSEQDARIRRLEEELARLDDETDDGPASDSTAPDARP
ncbi:PLDc_N domain-containing protein [Microbacterium foliorum]|uniref:PLD nuclease N-terminal domain-containing protein n=1 Tax=Microbacterium foliorum TaxID=104336 RepID=UPI0005ED20B7|nr:PLD nuclease N-terminal domain-containing protein [Microbacterium foliorum]AXL13034.1 PLDc_N domain-containing protein [Microbacterium foliorum]